MSTTVGTNSRGGNAKVGKNSSSQVANRSGVKTSTRLPKGVGYRTTDPNGNVTNYARPDTGSGLGTPISRTNALGATIPAKMTPETPAKIPSPYTLPDVGNVVGANNAGLAPSLSDTNTTYDVKTGQFVTAPTQTQPTDNFQSLFEQATQMGNTAFQEMGTGADRRATLEKANRLKEKQQLVNNYTGQLNSIVANSQAEQMKLEGQGRGQTSGFIGGEQARINREAAIAALPVQAQLATAQGNLQMAQEHIDKMFAIQTQDAQAKYQYKTNLISSVYQFATGQEQRRLDALKQKEDRAYDMQKTNLALKNDWAKTAVEYGQSSLAGSIMKLDQNSPTFSTDLATLQGRVTKPVAPTQPKAPTLQNFGTSDNPNWRQYNSSTGQWEIPRGYTPSSLPDSGTQTLKLAGTKSNVDEITNVLNNSYLSGAVGPNPLARFSPMSFFTGGKGNVVASIEQIRGQLTLDNLINAKAKGATFGALSEGELKLLNNSASKLGSWAVKDSDGNVVAYRTSETAFKQELDKINNYAKLDYIIKGGNPTDVGAIPQLDGTIWTRNSDGSLTQIK